MRLCRLICFFILYLKFSKKLWTITSVDLKKNKHKNPTKPKPTTQTTPAELSVLLYP